MSNSIDKYADVIDSRDVIARIEELEAERDAYEVNGESFTPATFLAWAEANPTERDELDALKALAEEAKGYAPDWKYGATLIRDSYFKDYAIELAEDIGAIKGTESWPLTCVDWDRAAEELKMDYTAVEFEDITYWVR